METARHDSIDFFLGATTPAGFKGYFEPLRHEPGMQMYLIKSGPGCGKSTLMKRLAQAAEHSGETVECEVSECFVNAQIKGKTFGFATIKYYLCC